MSAAIGSWLAFLVHGRPRIVRRKPLLRNTKPIPRRRSKARRGPERLPEYRAFVRQFPCCACGRLDRFVEAAHTGDHGLSQKSADRSCIPLCEECHRTGQWALHRIGPVRFEEIWGLRIADVIADLGRAWKER